MLKHSTLLCSFNSHWGLGPIEVLADNENYNFCFSGTPEAPPQVPTSLDTVPGTVTPVEEVILGTDGASNGLGGPSSSEGEVHTESGTGDLAGPDGAAVADIAATVQPAMDTSIDLLQNYPCLQETCSRETSTLADFSAVILWVKFNAMVADVPVDQNCNLGWTKLQMILGMATVHLSL